MLIKPCQIPAASIVVLQILCRVSKDLFHIQYGIVMSITAQHRRNLSFRYPDQRFSPCRFQAFIQDSRINLFFQPLQPVAGDSCPIQNTFNRTGPYRIVSAFHLQKQPGIQDRVRNDFRIQPLLFIRFLQFCLKLTPFSDRCQPETSGSSHIPKGILSDPFDAVQKIFLSLKYSTVAILIHLCSIHLFSLLPLICFQQIC